MPRNRARKALLAGLCALPALLCAAIATAFQVVQTENLTAQVLTSGVAFQFLKISHVPLNTGSEVTKEIIIVGEVGFETPVVPPPYSQRLTVISEPPPDAQIEVFVEYRFTPIQPTGNEAVVTTPKILGPDPFAFAFEIDPALLGTGTLEYRILARRLTSGPTDYQMLPREAVPGEPRWFTMGVRANALQVIGAQGGRFQLPDGNPADGETFLDVPRGLFVLPTAITLDEISLSDPSIPPGRPDAIKMYRMESQTAIRGNMLLTMLYPDFEYPQGQDGVIDGTQMPEKSVGMVFWDGFIWRKMGGIVNPANNTVTARIGGSGFFAIIPAGALSAEDQRPMEKIITPNGDGTNDIALFTFANPLDNIRVEIFDMTGHRIRTLYSATHNGWDGKDESGSTVESGVYIYQFESNGKRVSGLIAVAK
jgi:gliding motility-associated-like protein